MKKIKVFFVVFFLTMFIGSTSHSQTNTNPAVELKSIIDMLLYSYEDMGFLGDLSITIRGVKDAAVTLQVENPEGKKVFERFFKCKDSAYGESGPQCYMEPDLRKGFDPYKVKEGAHIFKILVDDQLMFSLKYDIKIVTSEYGGASVYVTGEWDKLAYLDLSASPSANVSFYLGSPEMCQKESLDLQAQLFFGEDFVASGHYDGSFYPSCSLASSYLNLFYMDDKNISVWLKGADLKTADNEGDYKLILYLNKKPIRTYNFKSANGKITSVPPDGLNPSLGPGRIVGYDECCSWIYAK